LSQLGFPLTTQSNILVTEPDVAVTGLKEKAIRGGVARLFAQATFFAVRIGTLAVLARLLDPKDFGLVGMVTALTGVLSIFRDFGLSSATVQRADVTNDQLSTLFWINTAVGLLLTVVLWIAAPIIVILYHEPRLFWVTITLSGSFLVNAAGVQHSAILQRQMRFTALAAIQIISLVASTAIGVVFAVLGFGYWSLVVMTFALPVVSTIGFWLTARWVPRAPRRNVGVRPMMRFGGAVTLMSILVYAAYNLDKILLGRFWGAEALGIYGRSYQIISIPTENLNGTFSEIAFATLSRLQDDPVRLRSYFLKGYSLIIAMTVPMTMAIALFPQDLITVVLGAKWNEAAPILRLLAPTILIFAFINPLGCLLYAIGAVGRCLRVSLVLTPLVIVAYLIGLPYGPKGVAIAFSTVMTLWAAPHIAWGIHGTVVSFRDILTTIGPPLLSGLVGGAAAFAVEVSLGPMLTPILRLLLGTTVLLSVYFLMLLYVMGQKPLFVDLLRGLISRANPKGA
jgi:O-antigen/teichoic acid export membrane protein